MKRTDDGRLIVIGNAMWKVHDFPWWQVKRWLAWARVCVDGRHQHIVVNGEVRRLERMMQGPEE